MTRKLKDLRKKVAIKTAGLYNKSKNLQALK